MKTTCMSGFLLCVLSGTAFGVVIDFEAFPGPDNKLSTADDILINAPNLFDDQIEQVTTQFAPLGIVFLPNPSEQNKNEILNDSSFSRTTGSRRNLLSTARGEYPFGPIEARFTVPVYEVKMAIGLGQPTFAALTGWKFLTAARICSAASWGPTSS